MFTVAVCLVWLMIVLQATKTRAGTERSISISRGKAAKDQPDCQDGIRVPSILAHSREAFKLQNSQDYWKGGIW